MTKLHSRLVKAKLQRTIFLEKDLNKFAICNKLIARGIESSASHRYSVAAGDLCNCGSYTSDDVVGISVNGVREGSLLPAAEEIRKAMDAGATIVTDTPTYRDRSYNSGARMVAAFLSGNGYVEEGAGVWRPAK